MGDYVCKVFCYVESIWYLDLYLRLKKITFQVLMVPLLVIMETLRSAERNVIVLDDGKVVSLTVRRLWCAKLGKKSVLWMEEPATILGLGRIVSGVHQVMSGFVGLISNFAGNQRASIPLWVNNVSNNLSTTIQNP